jgi:acetyl-CoA carboxylase carboxyltransferase component
VFIFKNIMVLHSRIDRNSLSYQANYTRQLEVVNAYKLALQRIIMRDEEESVRRHRERGKLLVRDRIELLCDPHTPFLEFSTLAAYDQYENQFPAAGIVTGIGIVHGFPVVIIANDATVKGGTYIPETIKKHLRAQEIAMQNHLPCVYLVDSGGIFLPLQARVFADRDNFGRIFYHQSVMSAMGIPQIAVVMGSCTAGGAYVPAMSDEVIMVRNQGTIFLGGPPLVKAATGEEISAEELGGALVHTTISGVADYIAQSDEHALYLCRQSLQHYLAAKNPYRPLFEPVDPKYDIDEIYGIIPQDSRQNIDPYEVLARLLDGSEFDEFKAGYGTTIVTGWGKILGNPVGVVASNGILFSESALKATHFIELCCHRQIPLLFLQDISGFMVGRDYEHKGIAKDGAKMVQAVANANVPKITLIMGKSYGAGNYAMAGRAMNSHFLFSWPSSKIAVMGGEQASIVLSTVKGSGKVSLVEQFEQESSAYYATSRLWDDGIIDPAETRNVLGFCLSVTAHAPQQPPRYGIFRM